MSTSSPSLSLDHHFPPSEQLCYVHCTICDTVLAVSVPCTSLFKTVTVRCGHCTNLLPVNMRGLLLPSTPPSSNHHHHHQQQQQQQQQQLQYLAHSSFFPPPFSHNLQLIVDGNITHGSDVFVAYILCDCRVASSGEKTESPLRLQPIHQVRMKSNASRLAIPISATEKPSVLLPKTYWAHFPHIHFGLMPDQAIKKGNVRQPVGFRDTMISLFFSVDLNLVALIWGVDLYFL
ncbi:hypothetical protein RJ639_029761 [Escallonia herrerae]|uniref:YABBY N-terminal domain-containing protein n=1 Tax=Escallonia herrerae TaxID=1293975 RepID=A0AA88X238_9ASTE|nr:hypothetical protein RJ639_029761 [Escallonia herrerae]